MKKDRIIFHIDVNSAYLSWEAVNRLQHGDKLDLRKIPSAVGGNPETRHGIILAKSIPAKKHNVSTGETLYSAYKKCPKLLVVPPNYHLYVSCSNAMINILKEYSPKIQRFSVDECFMDATEKENDYGQCLELAYTIKDRIKKELGFTVNIGISSNKLLAKMASDFKKPDLVHTLFQEEIKDKMWPLPVEDLFMVGRATAPKLHSLNIYTIGDLALYDKSLLVHKLKSFGTLLHNYANGIESSEVKESGNTIMKGMGASTTLAYDLEKRKEAHMVILSLTESLSMRLRDSKNCCSLIGVSIKSSDFARKSHERKLCAPTDSTEEIAEIACILFDEIWRGESIRHLGIRVSEFCTNDLCQISLFSKRNIEKQQALDKAVDEIRLRYGSKSLIRGVFLHSGMKPINGGIGEDDYPVMTSLL
ncbi:DNA polymerase Y family protein [Clostridium polynesiense]|uniref:DNA polymerase Y family protein n=1 Tax=Clostridium polynesiense TaxID=1325933 RepID=UPI00058AC07D|nr:DNA polymerase IV [Clostridium polynesiense]